MSFNIGRSTEGYFNQAIETASKDASDDTQEANASSPKKQRRVARDKSQILKKEFGFIQGETHHQYIDTALLDE